MIHKVSNNDKWDRSWFVSSHLFRINFDASSDTVVFKYFVVTEHYETALDKKIKDL